MTQQKDISQALQRLPMVEPSAAQWDAIEARAVAAGLAKRDYWYERKISWALAASVLLGLAVVLALPSWTSNDVGPAAYANTPPVQPGALDVLQRQNVLYERALRLVPASDGVVSVRRVSRETALADRVSAIDYTLTIDGARLSDHERALLWSERAMLMKRLVQLRYSSSATRTEF